MTGCFLLFHHFPFSPFLSPRLRWLAQGPARLKPALTRLFDSKPMPAPSRTSTIIDHGMLQLSHWEDSRNSLLGNETCAHFGLDWIFLPSKISPGSGADSEFSMRQKLT